MVYLLDEIDKVRKKIKAGSANTLLKQKPFAEGMYRFSMFMIDYYSRVRGNLKLDYDSFMIVQTTVSHTLYVLNKKKNNISYSDLESEWEKIIKDPDLQLMEGVSKTKIKSYNKLTISSICLITKLPKETVRRKTRELASMELLKISKLNGIQLGKKYKEVFQEFVPTTTLEVSKLLKKWNSNGVLKGLLNFRF